MKKIWESLSMSVSLVLTVCFLCSQAFCEVDDGPEQEWKLWWKKARLKFESELAEQGRTPLDIEAPKWYEVPYSTIGRMPLIDTGLRQPLDLPEIAVWADERIQEAGGELLALFNAAYGISEETNEIPDFSVAFEEEFPELATIELEMKGAGLPEELTGIMSELLKAMMHTSALRDAAFSGLSLDERKRTAELLPGYFVRQTEHGESIRGYTDDTEECFELIKLLAKVNFEELTVAGKVTAEAEDESRRKLEEFLINDLSEFDEDFVFEMDTRLGRIVVGGTGDNTYVHDYALILDLGGDDRYLNHTAATSLNGYGVAVHIDLGGNDTYRSDGFAQGCAVAGVSLFMDLSGDDVYISGHYSQGAALCGTSLFYEGGGDDTYIGDLGVQCFAIFGYSIFSERNGRDSYRCASMGQGCASTLGTAVMAESDGDDMYRAGGKYGFYSNYDASCSQGAASGMRPWPPSGKVTVYGGIGVLSEAGGNDTYKAYIIGQGSSYIFALGMLIDSEGNDTYNCDRYCRGVGVHLSAGVAVDISGDDMHNGIYGNNGYSLDRCSGVFVDFYGDDIYRTTGGIGFGHKPKGCGIFYDAEGDDFYAGTKNNYGKADYSFGDEAYSTGFFLDSLGNDIYPQEKYSNNSIWREGTYGYGQDADWEKAEPHYCQWWTPETDSEEKERLISSGDPEIQKIIEILNFPSPLFRVSALDPDKAHKENLFTAMNITAQSGTRTMRRHLVDLVQIMLIEETLNEKNISELSPFLEAEDYDMRLLLLQAMKRLEADNKALLKKAENLALDDPSEEVRGMACLALGSSQRKKTAGTLVEALKDEEWRVRRRAAIGLADLESKKTYTPLLNALKNDEAFQVRAYAARALGKLELKKAIDPLREALKDESEFVRCLAARALLLEHDRKSAITVLFDLLDWPNDRLRNQWVTEFLKDYTGKGDISGKEEWYEWWAESKNTFNASTHAEIYEKLQDAEEKSAEGKDNDALKIYRKIHKKLPDHQGAAEALADILNSMAWKKAVSGEELKTALEWAEESVEARPDYMNIDTLAVLQYLLGEKEKAAETLKNAMEDADENAIKQYESRLEEFEKGRVSL